jgi:hypothetical protein
MAEENGHNKKLPLSKRRELKSKIKSHDFVGHRYKIVWKKPSAQQAGGDAWGLCDDNGAPEKTMHISPSLNEYDFLGTCLDEAIHACNFSLDNQHVDEMASSIGAFLWRIGFRMKEEE